MVDDTYTLPSTEALWQYCYVISVPPSASECVSSVTMVDKAPNGVSPDGVAIVVTVDGEEMCHGDVKYIPGPIVKGLTTTEGPFDASVTGSIDSSGAQVTDSDDATVSPPHPSDDVPKDVSPAVEIKKYAGPEGKCSAAYIMDKIMVDDTYTLPSADAPWQYCYVISVPPTTNESTTECVSSLTMVDKAPNGLTPSGDAIDISLDSGKLCQGETKYLVGPVVTGLTETEGPFEATVTGKGVTTSTDVSAIDSATVVPPVEPRDAELCVHDRTEPPECAEDIVLMSDAATDFTVNPITIISQDTDTVTFTISNPFADDVLAMFYQFAKADSGSSSCYSESPFTYCHDPITVTAHCMTGPAHALSIVDIWFVDSKLVDSSDRDTVPECCQPNEQDAQLPTVQYSFKVYCSSKCGRREMRDLSDTLSQPQVRSGSVTKPEAAAPTAKQDNNSKLCSIEDYPCGDDGKSVYVCHYSAKEGYQTYCVPQSDSDVVAYFPKDYCGPCVGGYASINARK
jgi:hypothetical protein